jgi:phosphoribosyl 1,2-cyclic phosphodiesterase
MGNAALIDTGGPTILIDVGLGLKELSGRLGNIQARWDHVAAVLLTHTHGDHVRDAPLRWLARSRVPLYCHEGHLGELEAGRGFMALKALGLVRHYDDRPFFGPGGSRIEPLTLSHDGGPTFGFRVEVRPDGKKKGKPVHIGYVADTGCWCDPLADALTNVDLLALEFNHDVTMQRRSGRPGRLIARNLGDRGHLSNDQAAALLVEVGARSRPGTVRDVVLLHLSLQCNRPELALKAAREALRAGGRRATLHPAQQHAAFPCLPVVAARRAAAPR